MGVFDGVRRILADLGDRIEATGAAALPLTFAKFYPGGLAGLLDGLRAAGHGAEVDSWLGSGPNRPIAPGALAALLTPEQTDRIAYEYGIPAGRVATALAAFLPAAVAGESVDGRLKPQIRFGSQPAAAA